MFALLCIYLVTMIVLFISISGLVDKLTLTSNNAVKSDQRYIAGVLKDG